MFRKFKRKYFINKKRKMVATVEKKAPVKMAGYLEKRGKMRMVCRWKRLWFVLKGRLLHYYKSQLEYVNLSPCRGSLNMGIAASVRPGKGLELQVLTRSQSIILRAANRLEQEQWLQALVDAMALQDCHVSHPVKPVQHFRYPLNSDTLDSGEVKFKTCKSLDRLPCKPIHTRCINYEDNCEKGMTEDSISLLSKSTSSSHTNRKLSSPEHTCSQQNRSLTSISRSNTLSSTASFCFNRNQNIINKKLERFSLKCNKITSSDTAIPATLQSQIHCEEFIDSIDDCCGNNNLIDEDEKCHSLKELRIDVDATLPKICKSMSNSKVCDQHKSDYLTKTGRNENNIVNKIICSRNNVVNRSESLNSLKCKSIIDKKCGREMKVLMEGKTVYGSSDSVFHRNRSKHYLTKDINGSFEDEKKKILRHMSYDHCNNINNNSVVEPTKTSLNLNGKEILIKSSTINKSMLYGNTEIKSDTDLSIRKQSVIISGSCGELSSCMITNFTDDNININNGETQLPLEPVELTSGNELYKGVSSTVSNDFNLNDHLVNFNNDNLSSDSDCNISKIKTNSLLKRLIVKDKFNNDSITKENFSHNKHNSTLERKGTLKKRSLSFLRRMWKWKETRITEGDTQINDEQACSYTVTTSLCRNPTAAASSYLSEENERRDDGKNEAEEKPKQIVFNSVSKLKTLFVPEEPFPDYDGLNTEDEELVPALPPRGFHKNIGRSPSPWHDTPTNNKPIDDSQTENTANEIDDKPPPLPKKTRRSTRSTSSDLSTNGHSHHNYINFELMSDNNTASVLNNYDNDFSTNRNNFIECGKDVTEDLSNNFKEFSQPILVDIDMRVSSNRDSSEEPIYDVPRLHATLRASLRKNSFQDKLVPTRFLNNRTSSNSSHKTSSIGSIEYDSLDANPALWRSGPYDTVMTPDSLECESPWALSDDSTSLTITTWHHNNNNNTGSNYYGNQRPSGNCDLLQRHFITIEEKQYEDSLNN